MFLEVTLCTGSVFIFVKTLFILTFHPPPTCTSLFLYRGIEAKTLSHKDSIVVSCYWYPSQLDMILVRLD